MCCDACDQENVFVGVGVGVGVWGGGRLPACLGLAASAVQLSPALGDCSARPAAATPPLPGAPAGNVWTDTPTENEGAVEFWWSHGMVSFEVRDGILDNCDMSSIGPLAAAVGRGLPAARVYWRGAAPPPPYSCRRPLGTRIGLG